MFWRNNYSNDETIKEYFNSDDRTKYTYSETRSYRAKPLNNIVKEPKMMRLAIHSQSNETNVNTDYIMPSKSNSTMSTPRQKSRVSMPNTRRVLRSKTTIGPSDNEINGTFVRETEFEEDITQQSYRIGALNTNTNNSGPDEVEHSWSTSTGNCDYHLSADEDQGSDTATTSNDKHNAFGSNNANIKKSQTKVSNQWFQKNMYGLPNDESDDVQPEYSGAISGDEQYDIVSFQNSNAFQKSKSTKSKLKKTSKSDTNNRRLDSMICSPVAVLSFLMEYVWLCVITTGRVISHCSRYLTNYSKSPRWFLTPLYLPGAVINSVIYSLAYSIDRIFGTTTARRWLTPSNYNRRSTFVRFMLNTLWILLWVAAAFIAMHCLIGVNNHTDSSTTQSLPLMTIVSESVSRIVGKECMEADNCCHSKLAFVRRSMFCMFSLPARWVLANSVSQSTEDISQRIDQNTGNTSELNVIIYQLLDRIRVQEELVRKYNNRMTNFEKESQNKAPSQVDQNDRLQQLTKEMLTMTTELRQLQTDLANLSTFKISLENSVKKVATEQKEGIDGVTIDIDNLRGKLDEDMKLMKALMEKVDKSDINSNTKTINLANLLAQVQNSVNQLTSNFIEINDRTKSLESANVISSIAVTTLKKEILDEMSKEFIKYKDDQRIIMEKMNEQLSKLEESLEKNYSKLLEKDDLQSFIESYLVNVESNIKNEVNSTMWNNLKEHVRNLFESSSSSCHHSQVSDKLPIIPAEIVAQPCCNPLGICRRESSCVRVSKVRQMITDALKLYSADRIGLADFALESAGGTIATTRCTETYTDRAATLTIFGIPLLRLTNSPRTIIQPNINPGECWAMKGSRGSVVVQLSAFVKVTAVTIDHIPRSLSPSGSIDSAIKEFEIKALKDESDTIGQSLGNFTYLIDSVAVQTFQIEKPVVTNLVEMIVKSNYDNEEYTCIYRFRVHGDLIKL